MKKRFVPIMCLVYSGFVLYLIISKKINFFLAPNMQVYSYISVVPLFVIGILTLFRTSHIKFRITDLVLIIPIILFLFVGDGTLSTTFAKNRALSNVEKIKTVDNTKKEETKEEEKEYDFSEPYFDVIDSTYQGLANYLTYTKGAKMYSGKTIRVTGFVIKDEPYLNDNLFAIGRLSITCCAADAEFTGFMVSYDASKVKENGWYTIEGVLENSTDAEGYDILSIRAINIKSAKEPKEKYVYMCSEYGTGSCKDLHKYEFVY